MITPTSFVGRCREIESVRAALARGSGTRFVEITGPGGIGKTTLIEEVLRRLPTDVPVLSLTERDPCEDAASAMLEMASRFVLVHGRSREWKPFFRAARLHRLVARRGPAGRAIAPFLPRDWRIDPEGALTDTFLASVGRLLRGDVGRLRAAGPPFSSRTVVLALDGYERAEPILARWLHRALLPRLARQDLPYEPKVVFAGREPLAARDQSWDALAYVDATLTVPLAPLSPEEATSLLEARGILDETRQAKIVRLSGGHPLWLSLAAQPVPAPGPAGEEGCAGVAAARAQVVKHLERRVLRWVEGERERRWIRAAAHLDWFDRDALRSLLGAEGETAYDWLLGEPALLDPASAKHAIEPFARSVLRAAVRLDSESLSDDLTARAWAFQVGREEPSPASPGATGQRPRPPARSGGGGTSGRGSRSGEPVAE